jgi:glycosyltransferase involved in cell wall biosynthesis
MTAYNREEFVGAAIESVLLSTYANFELIVLDDVSNDNTVNIIKSYAEKDQRIRLYVNEKNLGDYPNRNEIAKYAQGKYLKYFDSDDIMYPHCLEVMVRNMEMFPEGGFGLCTNSDPEVAYPVVIQPKQSYLEHFNGYSHFLRAPGSSIIKREVFEKEKGFSGKPLIGDNEFWFRLARKYPLVKFSTGLYWDRTHANQERSYSYAKKHYRQLREGVVIDAMNHPDCPLTPKEKKEVFQSIKRFERKQYIFSALKKVNSIFKAKM